MVSTILADDQSMLRSHRLAVGKASGVYQYIRWEGLNCDSL